MAAIADVISQVKLQEYARNEQAIRDRCSFRSGSGLSDPERALLNPFIEWCRGMSVRHCPATPAVVATFVQEYDWRGPKIVVPMLQAIEALHDHHMLANPVATGVVRAAISDIFGDDLADLISGFEAPKSWSKTEKKLFWILPKDIQQIVARREYQRDLAVKQAMNEAGNLRLKVAKLEAAQEKSNIKENSNEQLEVKKI